jgi:hypothetical protein
MPVLPNSQTSWVSIDGLYDDAWGTQWPLEKLKIDVAGKTAIDSASVRKEG